MIARALILSLALVAGCMRSPLDNYWVPPRPLASDAGTYRPPAEPLENDDYGVAAAAPADPEGELTLEQAWRLALLRHPSLVADAYEVRSAEASRMQAGAMPNPAVDVRLDDFGGSGSRRSFVDSNVRLRVTQVIELGGKRASRVAVAAAERDLAAWDYEARRVDLAAQVSARYVVVLEAQQAVALNDEAVRIADQMHKIVEARVDAGGLLPIHKDHSLVRSSLARIKLAESKLKLESARRRLASAWNSSKATFTRVAGELALPEGNVPSLESLEAHLSDHPSIAQTGALLARRQAQLELARANAVPDIEVGAGARYFRDMDDYAFLVEMSVPLPLFDRNQGEILSRRLRVARARAQGDEALALARDALISAHRDLSIAHHRASALAADVLPRLESLLTTTRAQFEQGTAKLDDMLDAHRDLLRARVDHLDALAAYHGAASIIEGLIGRPLGQVQTR